MGLLRFLNPFRLPGEFGGMAKTTLRSAGVLDEGESPAVQGDGHDPERPGRRDAASAAMAHGRAMRFGFLAAGATGVGTLTLAWGDPPRLVAGLCFALMFLLSALGSRRQRRRMLEATLAPGEEKADGGDA